MSENPFYRPISNTCANLRALDWRFPFLPGLVNAVIILFVMAILCALYATIGVAAQISSSFLTLIAAAKQQLGEGSAVERSAHVVTIGVYALVLLPFWLIQLPFEALGVCWNHLKTVGLISVASAALYAWLVYIGVLTWPFRIVS